MSIFCTCSISRAFLLKFAFQTVDDVLHGVLFALRVQDEQCFVAVLHDSGFLLNVFIAETTPLSIGHFHRFGRARDGFLDGRHLFFEEAAKDPIDGTAQARAPIPMRRRGISSRAEIGDDGLEAVVAARRCLSSACADARAPAPCRRAR